MTFMETATTGSIGYAPDVKRAFTSADGSGDEQNSTVNGQAVPSKPRQKARRKNTVDAEAEAKRRCMDTMGGRLGCIQVYTDVDC